MASPLPVTQLKPGRTKLPSVAMLRVTELIKHTGNSLSGNLINPSLFHPPSVKSFLIFHAVQQSRSL
ncbi:hypothetical protein MHYP_G00141570 [Metynnis hypsauchen]